MGVKHPAIPDKLELGADLSFSRSTATPGADGTRRARFRPPDLAERVKL